MAVEDEAGSVYAVRYVYTFRDGEMVTDRTGSFAGVGARERAEAFANMLRTNGGPFTEVRVVVRRWTPWEVVPE